MNKAGAAHFTLGLPPSHATSCHCTDNVDSWMRKRKCALVNPTPIVFSACKDPAWNMIDRPRRKQSIQSTENHVASAQTFSRGQALCHFRAETENHPSFTDDAHTPLCGAVRIGAANART